MKATVSWMHVKPDRAELPRVEIIEGEEAIIDYITRLHAFLDGIYLLVEFHGILYDVTEPSGVNAARLIRAMIDSKYDEAIRSNLQR